MIYEYITEDEQHIVERDFPAGEAPQEVETEWGPAYRYYGGKIQIPEYMRAGSDNEMQHYDRKDWNTRKRFY